MAHNARMRGPRRQRLDLDRRLRGRSSLRRRLGGCDGRRRSLRRSLRRRGSRRGRRRRRSAGVARPRGALDRCAAGMCALRARTSVAPTRSERCEIGNAVAPDRRCGDSDEREHDEQHHREPTASRSGCVGGRRCGRRRLRSVRTGLVRGLQRHRRCDGGIGLCRIGRPGAISARHGQRRGSHGDRRRLRLLGPALHAIACAGWIVRAATPAGHSPPLGAARRPTAACRVAPLSARSQSCPKSDDGESVVQFLHDGRSPVVAAPAPLAPRAQSRILSRRERLRRIGRRCAALPLRTFMPCQSTRRRSSN